MKKIIFSGFISMLFSLDVSAMLDLSLEDEAQNTPAKYEIKYNELSESQRRLLHPIPTQEKIELTYSPEALGFLDKVAAGVFTNSNLFQKQFLNVFSASELNRIAKNSFDAHVGFFDTTLKWASLGLYSPTFQEIKGDMLVGLLFAGWYSLSDDPKEQDLLHARMEAVKKGLSANNQPYFNDVLHYLHETVLKTLNYEGFKRIHDLIGRKNSIYRLFSRYEGEIENITPSNNNGGAIVKANKTNFTFEQYKFMFSQNELEKLNQCPDHIQERALVIRSADMAGIAAMQVIETKKEVNTLKKQMKKDRETAQEIVTNLQDQIKEQKEQLEVQKEETNAQKEKNKTLEERIAALEASAIKKDQEEKTEKEQSQLIDEPKPPQRQEVQEEDKKQQEGTFVTTGHRERGNFKFGSRWKYCGEVVKLEKNVEAAEGEGEFSCGQLKIVGHFSRNRLDLSNAIIKFLDSEASFNSVGYFNMENIKMIKGSRRDKQKQQIIAIMPDDSRYFFSPNLIEYTNKDGEITKFVAER